MYSPEATKTENTGEAPSVPEEPKAETPRPADDSVTPYSTYLRRGLVKGIKLRAFNNGWKDREVVEAALEEYFKSHPL